MKRKTSNVKKDRRLLARIASKCFNRLNQINNCSLIATQINGARKALGWSQSELARRCGVTSAAISLIEKGNRTPGFDTLSKIASALNIDVSRFYVKTVTVKLSEEKKFYIKFGYLLKLNEADQDLIHNLACRLLLK